MKYIHLQPDEVLLYEGKVSLPHVSTSLLSPVELVDLVLTNTQLYFVKIKKKLFSKEEATVKSYGLEEIKVYDGLPQIRQVRLNSPEVSLYLVSEEISLLFCSSTEAHKFVKAVYKLITGKSATERGAGKVKNAVNIVNDTLGIDTVDTVKNVLENGFSRSLLGGLSKKSHSSVKHALLEKAFLPQSPSPVQPSCEDSIELLKKLKELLDAGIITQEEFDRKKQELLKL